MSSLRDHLVGQKPVVAPPLHFPLWKTLLVLAVVLFGIVYALPNLYPDDPAVQITGSEAAVEINQVMVDKVTESLKAVGLSSKAVEQQDKSLLVRFANTEDQLKAKEYLQKDLGNGFLMALNLAPTTPGWLRALGAYPLKLGLDLRGGVHFLLEVDVDQAMSDRMKAYKEELRAQLREKRFYFQQASIQRNTELVLTIKKAEQVEAVDTLLRESFRDFTLTQEGMTWTLVLTDFKKKEIREYAIKQNLTTLRNRVDELGVAEASVQRQGSARIVVQLPGIQDTATAKRILGRTASLEFRLQDWEQQGSASQSGIAPSRSEFFPFKNNETAPVLLKKKVITTGSQVIDAKASYDENGRPQVNITLDSKGGKQMFRSTKDNISKPMAVLFVETKSTWVEGEDGERKRVPVVDKTVINVATIQAALSSSFRITGLDSPDESSELALLLRAGALAAPLYFVEERTVGPSLGQENITAGLISIVLGFVAVLVFMVLWYRSFGMIANIALLVNLVVLVAFMSLIPGATLTLPGMAGIVLTVGMAVDANVLIFERIREELASGARPLIAIDRGYDRAFVAIWDANLTTLIVALILFAAGNGPVKGFAVTLSLGILTSMFTAIIGTRALVSWFYKGKRLEALAV